MLFTCDRAKGVWSALGLMDFIDPLLNMERSGSVILEKLLCGDMPGERQIPIANGIETVMVAAWYLWWDRRKRTHDEAVGSPERPALSIKGIVANSLALKAKKPMRKIKWERPATGVIKLNVDASFHLDSGAGATGAILRDSSGSFIAATCTYWEAAIDAPSMEARAVLEGLRLAKDLGIYALAVECDSLEIVNAIIQPAYYRASGVVITDDCREMMTSFGRATITHCARESNAAAHVIARASYRRQCSKIWRDKPPDFLIPSIVTDLIIV